MYCDCALWRSLFLFSYLISNMHTKTLCSRYWWWVFFYWRVTVKKKEQITNSVRFLLLLRIIAYSLLIWPLFFVPPGSPRFFCLFVFYFCSVFHFFFSLLHVEFYWIYPSYCFSCWEFHFDLLYITEIDEIDRSVISWT